MAEVSFRNVEVKEGVWGVMVTLDTSHNAVLYFPNDVERKDVSDEYLAQLAAQRTEVRVASYTIEEQLKRGYKHNG